MKFALYVFGLLPFMVLVADGLQCHVCVGTPESDCAKNVTAAMGYQTCRPPRPRPHGHYLLDKDESEEDIQVLMGGNGPPPNPEFDLHCIDISTRANRYASSLVIRECGFSTKGANMCTELRMKKKDLLECNSCDADLCN